MEARYDKLRDFVYSASFDLPCDADILRKELIAEDWQVNSNGYGQSVFSFRHSVTHIRGTNLTCIIDYFHSDAFRKGVILDLYRSKNFAAQWGIDPIMMMQNTTSFGTLVLDKPGHVTGLHLDNRLLVASGMCYFIDGNDPDQGTVFYSDQQKNDPLEMTTGFGKGWMAANTHDSWHMGWNRSQQDRYSILFGIRLKI
jgi:hypothetical protein